jgi:very-short-patch-repair endonuclease
MLTGVFKDRTRLRRRTSQPPHQALHRLIYSKTLARHRPAHRCEVGPFVVEYLFRDRGLIVELEPAELADAKARARIAFLNELGYRVLTISRRRVRLQPDRVLDEIRAALR